MSDQQNIGKQRLKEALLSLAEEENADLENVEEPMLSSAYQRKMLRLLSAPKIANKRRAPLRRTVIALVAAALLGMMTLVIAAHEPMTSFMVNVYEKFATVSIHEESSERAPRRIEKLYTISDMPEGFAVGETIIGTTMAHTTWRTIFGEEIVLTQALLDTNFLLDTVDADNNILWLGDYRVFRTTREGVAKYIWNTDEYFFYLISTAPLEPAEIEELILSIHERPMPSFALSN